MGLIVRWVKYLSNSVVFMTMFRFLPLKAIYLFNKLLGTVLSPLFDSYINKVLINASPILCSSVLEKKVKKNYISNILDFVCDTLYFTSIKIDNKKKEEFFVVEGKNYLDEALAQKQGVILTSYHFTGMSAIGYYLNTLYESKNITVIAPTYSKTGYSKILLPYWNVMSKAGCSFIHFPVTTSFYRKFAKELSDLFQKNNIVLFLNDWFFNEKFPLLKFFGNKVHTPTGAAFYNVTQNIPLVFFSYFKENKKFFIFFKKPIFIKDIFPGMTSKEQILKGSEMLNQLIEHEILCHPDQWIYWQGWNKIRRDKI